MRTSLQWLTSSIFINSMWLCTTHGVELTTAFACSPLTNSSSSYAIANEWSYAMEAFPKGTEIQALVTGEINVNVTCSFTACLKGASTSSILPSIFCPSDNCNQMLFSFFFLRKQTERENGLMRREIQWDFGVALALGTERRVVISVLVFSSADVALRSMGWLLSGSTNVRAEPNDEISETK